VKLVLALLPILTLAGCGGRDPFMLPVAPSGTKPPDPNAFFVPLGSSPDAEFVRDVMVGERVEGVFGSGGEIKPRGHHFYITVPANGTLVATLEWDPFPLGTLLMLSSETLTFRPMPPAYSPVVARIPVNSGGRYPVVVGLFGADWLPQDPYVLTTRLEPR
jgi:hypothetical protein